LASLDKLNEWKAEHPERVKEGTRKRVQAWRHKNPDKYKAQIERSSEQKRRSGYYEKNKRTHINRQLVKQYGITIEEYEAMLESQNGKCAICETETCPTGKRFAVDHCHDTGKVRGLLCKNCNIGLGMFKDDVKMVKNAFKYLRSTK